MKKFSNEEKLNVLNRVQFLIIMGYTLSESEESLTLTKGNIQISICNTHLYDPCEIFIKFLKENEVHVGSWLQAAIEKFSFDKKTGDCLDLLNGILTCFEKNYSDISNIDFCRKCRLEISAYIDRTDPEMKKLKKLIWGSLEGE